jgi:hypothetical protein
MEESVNAGLTVSRIYHLKTIHVYEVYDGKGKVAPVFK